MNLKFIAIMSSVSILASCAQVQDGLKASLTNFSEDFQKARQQSLNSTASRSSSSKPGSLTTEQCKASKGKSKKQMEQLVGLKLDERNSSGFSSIAESYNLEITGVKTRYGTDFGVCSIFIDPDTQRVTNYSIVM